MRVRSRLRVSVSKSIWSFWTPSMNSSRESSPGVERKGIMGRRRSRLLTRAQRCSLVRGREPRLEEVAVNRDGQGARDQSLAQISPKASSVARAEAGGGGGQQRPLWPHCVPAPCLVPSSPVAQSLSAHLLVVCTRPSGGTAPVWPMAVDHGAGTEQALSKRVRASRGCLGGK